MSKFNKGFIKKDYKDFNSTKEAVLFLFEYMNKWTTALNEIYEREKEASAKEGLVANRVTRLMYDKLETYGIKISYDELLKEARTDVDKDWPRIKKEIAEILEAREQSVEDLIKRTQDNNDNPNV